MKIEIEEIVRKAAPDLKVIVFIADVTNCPTTDSLIKELNDSATEIKQRYELPQVNKRPGIAGTRAAYKALGKDPNRYRPSAEALSRRVLRDMELYHISNLVDLINVISLKSGYSIGGFDYDKISGDTLKLGRGEAEEEFEGIGRGELNIEGLPVYRDAIGGIGTPTSDHERTKLTLDTKRLLMCVNVYAEDMPIEQTIREITRLLECHANLNPDTLRIQIVN